MPAILIEPSTGREYVDHGGHRRYLSAIHSTAAQRARFAAFSLGDVPESEFIDFDIIPDSRVRNLDQDGTSACVGHGAAGAFSTSWKAKNGTDHDFSAFFVYGLINGGRDAGANVGDSLDAMIKYGVCTEAEVPVGQWRSSRFPATAYDVAKRFKPKKAEQVGSYHEMLASVSLGFTVVFGIDIGRNFDPDSNGVVGRMVGGGGGHCMYARGLKKINGIWYAKIENSWGRSWGIDGWCYMEQSYFQNFDGYRLEITAEDPQETNKPPIPT